MSVSDALLSSPGPLSSVSEDSRSTSISSSSSKNNRYFSSESPSLHLTQQRHEEPQLSLGHGRIGKPSMSWIWEEKYRPQLVAGLTIGVAFVSAVIHW